HMRNSTWNITLLGITLLATGLSGCASVPAASVQAQPPELIPRQTLLGNPFRASAQLSPDGTRIAFLAPREGVLNVWVADIGAPDQAVAVTDDRVRPIRNYFWSPDSRQILYIQDKGGDENFLLYGVDLATGETRNYTPFENVRVFVVGMSTEIADE